MKLKLICFLFIIVACILVQSCSSTKYVPEGEYWLQNTTIKSDNRDIASIDMEPFLAQKPNYKTFSLFRLPLFIYNLSGRDSTKWINRVLRNGGEPPVLFDSTMVDKTVDDFTRLLRNKGYVHTVVTSDVKKENNRVKVTYNIRAGEPYQISDYEVNIPDSVFSRIRPLRSYLNNRFNRDSIDVKTLLLRNSLVKKKSLFNLTVLDEERERISSIFRRFGYYDFNKEYIGFVADTTAGKNMVNLELTAYPFMQKAENGEIIEVPHRQYLVKEVNFYVDYNPVEDEVISKYIPTDTVSRGKGEYKVFYGKRGKYIKPHVILDNCYIVPGTLYNEYTTATTYNSLAQLNILRNTNIRYEPFTENDTTKLRAIITCMPGKKQGISTEVEGTNSGGFFGVGASIGYLHRNIFKGSELFNIKLQGSYEAVTPSFSSFSDNYFELGGEMSVTFPRFMFPFLKRDLRRRLHASTQLTSNYIYQRRPGYFTRTILSTGIKYIWNQRRNNLIKHSFDLIDVSYIRIPQSSLNSDFIENLAPAARVYSFTDQFILSTGYSYTNTNFNPARRRIQPIYSLRAQVETAGNLLSLIANIADSPKDSIGSRSIFGTRFAQYARFNVDYSRAIPVDEKNVIAWRVGGGLAFPYGNNKEVPIQKRFFSGGANSVRGWGIRELGPGAFYNEKTSNFYNQSGDIRFDANIEYRSKVFWKMELAAFLDAGNVWTVKKYEKQEKGDFKFDSFYKQIALSWGIGLRLDLDFVLIRLDGGWKAYDPADYPSEMNRTKWPIKEPFRFQKNTAWHIAVGYPF